MDAWVTAQCAFAHPTGDDGPFYSAACCVHRRLGAGHRRAPHVARLRLVVAPHAVHGLAVVPHHEVMQRPFMDMDEFALRGVLGEIAQQQPRLGHAHALDGAGMR